MVNLQRSTQAVLSRCSALGPGRSSLVCKLGAGLLIALGSQTSHAQDIALILIDDVGIDRIAAYGEHPDPGNTPNIDGLAQAGVMFRRAYAFSVCSPTRAALLTGRLPHRTGIGSNISFDATLGLGLSIDECTIPDLLPPDYRAAAFGKWHLANEAEFPRHPFDLGFNHFSGTLGNLGSLHPLPPNAGYFAWMKSTMGHEQLVYRYATNELSRDVRRYLAAPRPPTFLWIASHAAHGPLHAPPPNMHSFNLSGPPEDTPVAHGKAIIEALDTRIGTILQHLDADDWVIVMGDNGTSGVISDRPFPADHGKGTMYEGGIRVPLMIRGPGVQPGVCDSLVMATDLYATIIELAGGVSSAEDSISLVPYLGDPQRPPLRDFAYSERFTPTGPGPPDEWWQAIVGERYKLIRHSASADQFYDLHADRFEQRDLIARDEMGLHQRRAYQWLLAKLPYQF
ncbi:MAG: arylsulfatase B [Planctomycetota bacterium]|jgi:arylsulfatase B